MLGDCGIVCFFFFKIQAYLGRNKSENSGDMVFPIMSQFW